jgi:hypothetical protein
VKGAPVVNGYIFTLDSTGSTNVEDYVVVVGADLSASYGATVKLMFTDGTKKVVDLDEFKTATDATDNSVTNTSVLGKLYTYETNKDDEYALTPAITAQTSNANNETGFDKVQSIASMTSSDTNSSGKVKYLGGNNINDDAVIFMNDGGDYKVITGAQLKAIKGWDTSTSSALITNITAYSNENSSTGYDSVVLAYVTTGNESVSADTTYGYVTADPITVRNADDKNVTQLVIWTEDGQEVTLNTKASLSIPSGLAEGSIVSYGVNGDNEIDELTVLATVGAGTVSANTAAVTSYDGTYVAFTNSSNTTTSRYEITKDSVIVYINAGDVEGSTSGAIKLASKTGAASGATYYNNAYYVLDGSDIDVLFIDINNDIDDVM